MVLAVRRRDVHHVDVGIGEQLLVRAVRLGEPVLVGERLGARLVAGGDGVADRVVDVAKVARHRRGDAAGRDDPPADRAVEAVRGGSDVIGHEADATDPRTRTVRAAPVARGTGERC